MEDIDRARAEFFRKTRTMTVLLYAALAVAAIACLAIGIGQEPVWAVASFAAAVGLGALLFLASARIPVTARIARHLLWIGPLAGVLVANFVDVDLGDRGVAIFLGALGGFFLGAIVGIARIRRRLATDDELLLRQRRLGFDPEHPASWIRGRAQR